MRVRGCVPDPDRVPGSDPALLQRGRGDRDAKPDLSPGCRAVELSRLRRGAVEPVVEGLSRPCLSSLVEPVEFLSSLSRLTPCACASSSCRAVEFLSSFSVEAVELCAVECAVELEPGM